MARGAESPRLAPHGIRTNEEDCELRRTDVAKLCASIAARVSELQLTKALPPIRVLERTKEGYNVAHVADEARMSTFHPRNKYGAAQCAASPLCSVLIARSHRWHHLRGLSSTQMERPSECRRLHAPPQPMPSHLATGPPLRYLKLTIQFCYIIMFSIQWPLCGLCGMVNNAIQAPCDQFSLMFLHRRAMPALCPEGIGAWQESLHKAVMVGAPVAVALFSLTTGQLETVVHLTVGPSACRAWRIGLGGWGVEQGRATGVWASCANAHAHTSPPLPRHSRTRSALLCHAGCANNGTAVLMHEKNKLMGPDLSCMSDWGMRLIWFFALEHAFNLLTRFVLLETPAVGALHRRAKARRLRQQKRHAYGELINAELAASGDQGLEKVRQPELERARATVRPCMRVCACMSMCSPPDLPTLRERAHGLFRGGWRDAIRFPWRRALPVARWRCAHVLP